MSRRSDLLEHVQRFWVRVDTSSECWLWTGEVNNKGYGVFSIYEGDGREKILAHRFAALMAGLPVRSSRDVVMHACDTPRCVRASHLSIGTQKDNLRDALDKDRMNLTGLFALTRHICKDCGAEFMAKPNARYCEIHRAEKRWA